MGQSIVIHGLIKNRAEIAGQRKAALKAADAIKDDLAAIDRALVLCGYQDDPEGIAARGQYRQLFGRNELKLLTREKLPDGPADDETIATWIIDRKGWGADDTVRADVPKRVRHLLQREQKVGRIAQNFGPDGCLWRLAQ